MKATHKSEQTIRINKNILVRAVVLKIRCFYLKYFFKCLNDNVKYNQLVCATYDTNFVKVSKLSFSRRKVSGKEYRITSWQMQAKIV